MTRITAALTLACLAGSALSQQTINVPNDLPTIELALNPVISGLAAGDTIELSPGTYFNNGEYTVSVPDITIRGLGGSPVALDQFGTGRIFAVSVGASGSLTLENLRLVNGDAGTADGGAVFMENAGTLTLIGCELEDNTAQSGGAIWAAGTAVVMQDCTLTGNSSTVFGGAIRTAGDLDDSVTVTGSTFANNAATGGNGGAIDHAGSGAPLTITDSVFSGNTCTLTGGAVYAINPTAVVVSGTTFSDNVALGTSSQDTGGLFLANVADATVRDCDFVRNLCAGSGGALRFSNTAGDIIDCRFVENEASNGGAIQAVGSLAMARVYNSVFEGNSARRTGSDTASGAGAIMVNQFALADVYNSLFVNNTATTGGAMSSATSGELRVFNSTFVGNDADAVGGALRRLNADAIVFANSCIFFGNLPTGSQIAINGVGDNDEVNYSLVEGGFTGPGTGTIDGDPMFVDAANGDYSLMPGSPAIDAGSSARYGFGPLSDLAGNDRGQDDPDTADTGEAIIGAVIDMGAFEFTTDSGIADCPADQNFDGILTPADFNAWIINYNAGCD